MAHLNYFNNNKGDFVFPYEIHPVDADTNEELLEYFQGEKTGFVQVGPEKYFFPSKFTQAAPHMYNFQARRDDIWVATFPRSGTTWTQELVWMIANDLNYAAAQQDPLTKRFPFFEFSIFMHDKTKEELIQHNAGSPEKQHFINLISKPGFEYLPSIQSQRFIKTHLPFSLLPPSIMEEQAKVIYVARNPKDVAVSFYHLNRLYVTQGYVGGFPRYWNYFERSLNPWMPYWSHIKEGWARRNDPNVLFMFYEDMSRNLSETIEKVAHFLGKTMNAEEVAKLAEYLRIENFRVNPAVNSCELQEVGLLKKGEQGFVRKGKTGGWSEEFTPELTEQADRWIEENLKNTDLRFPLR